jgi:hypothetical protein
MTITVDEKRILEELAIAQQEDIGLKSRATEKSNDIAPIFCFLSQ